LQNTSKMNKKTASKVVHFEVTTGGAF